MFTDKLPFLKKSKPSEEEVEGQGSGSEKTVRKEQGEGVGPEGGNTQKKETFENRSYIVGQRVEGIEAGEDGEGWKLLQADKESGAVEVYKVYPGDQMRMKKLKDDAIEKFWKDNAPYKEFDEVVFTVSGSAEEREGRITGAKDEEVTVTEIMGDKADEPRKINFENVSKKFKEGQQVRFFPPGGGIPQVGKIESFSKNGKKTVIKTDAGDRFTVERDDITRI